MAPRSRAAAARSDSPGPGPSDTAKGVLLLMMPSVTDINGAGGVAARWQEYKRELEAEAGESF
jgi:hypothetical protein